MKGKLKLGHSHLKNDICHFSVNHNNYYVVKMYYKLLDNERTLLFNYIIHLLISCCSSSQNSQSVDLGITVSVFIVFIYP